MFLLSLFWPSTCSISLSLSLLFFSFFLPSYLSFFLLSFGSVFFSLSFFFCLLCFCFMKTNNFSSILCFFWFPVLFSLSNPLFLSLFFSGIQLCFLFNINVFGFKKHKLKNTNFWSNGELQQNGFFNNLCFAKCEKLSFFFALFGQFLVDVRKTL